MAVRRLKFPLTINQGTGMAVSNTGIDFIGISSLIQIVSIPQEITTISNVQFNAVTSSASTLLLGSTILSEGGFLDNFNVGESLNVSDSLIVLGDATVSENVTAEQIISELTSTATLYKSGSTLFGDTADDIHNFSGSVYQSGSMSYNGYIIDEISNDTLLTDASSTAIVTENAVKYFVDNSALFINRQEYVRKNFNKTALSVSNNTASFSAFSASAPSEMVSNNEDDFLFFNNGQVMEHDALTIQQVESVFLLKVDGNSIGYNLESDDEIKAWGRFQDIGYIDFDGLNQALDTNYSGSALPGNKTYSWWMKSTYTARNYAVFGYGSNKTAFVPNFSSGKPLMWNGASWFVYWDATEDDNDGEWHHWMLYNDVLAITGSKLYVDGALQTVSLYKTSGTVSNLNNQSQPLTIGSFQNNSTDEGRHFSGSIKEFSVFPGDKTSNASTYYNNGTPYDVTNEIGLQAYWRMDENQGIIAYDSSGEGNHGTLDGPTWSTL